MTPVWLKLALDESSADLRLEYLKNCPERFCSYASCGIVGLAVGVYLPAVGYIQ